MSDYPLSSTWAEVDAAAQAVKNGLPKANLSGAVQASLDKADGAVQVGDQATKTPSMTQAVGVDLQGKLWTAPGGGGGGDAEVFWITITASGGSYVMDCTWADIADAMSNGMLIVAKIGDRRYWWNGDPTDDGLQLVRVYVSSSSKAYAEAFIISDGGTIARTSNVSLNPSDLWLNTLSLPSSEKEKARNNIGAGDYSKPSGGIPLTDLAESVETPETVVQVSGNTPTIDAPAGNTIYKCTGDVTQLTVQNYGYTEFVLKFNTSLTTDPTVTIDSRIWLPDGFTFEKNRHYEMNVDSNGFALIADWVYVD